MLQQRFWKWIVVGTILLFSMTASSSAEFPTDVGTPETTLVTYNALMAGPIYPKVLHYEDPNREVDLSHVRQLLAEGKFQATPKNYNAGYSASRFWFYFELQIEPNSIRPDGDHELFIEIDYPHFDSLVITQSVGDSVDRVFDVGDHYRFQDRPVGTSGFLLPVHLPVGYTVSFFAKLDTTGGARFPVSVWSKERYLEYYGNKNIVNGLFFGLVFILAIYNAVIGITIRDFAYLHYFGYFVSFGLFLAVYWGYGFQYLWPNAPHLNEFSIPVLGFATLGFGYFFSQSFLKLKQSHPKIDKMLALGGYFSLAMILLCFVVPYRTMINTSAVVSVIAVFLLFYAGIVSWLSGYKQARFYVAGWSIFLVAMFLFAMANKGVIPINFVTLHANQFGALLEAFFFSLALGDRINREFEEKRAIELKSQLDLEEKNIQLRSLLKEVQRSSDLKDQFLATISHELRTPMNGLEGSLEIIGDRIQGDDLVDHFRAAKESANSMTQIIDRVLELSELQSGKLIIHRAPFKLSEMVDGALLSFKNEALDKQLEFVVDVDTSLDQFVVADGPRIQTILYQLVENAIKFTQRGKISIKVGCEKQADMSSDGLPFTHRLQLTVSDTGIGIQPEQRQLIFEKFRQVDGSFSRQYSGLGIGLSLVTALVEKMSGQLSLESSPGDGSTFSVEIPIELGEVLPKNKSQSPVHDKNARILIVEDNRVNQLMLKTMVSKLGYEAITADNGQEAVKQTEQGLFDCILMDCQMPVMDGFEATRIIREGSNQNAQIPIIAVTANTMSSDRQRCLDIGMNDYIKKPINKAIIDEKLTQWLTGDDQHTTVSSSHG